MIDLNNTQVGLNDYVVFVPRGKKALTFGRVIGLNLNKENKEEIRIRYIKPSRWSGQKELITSMSIRDNSFVKVQAAPVDVQAKLNA